MATPGAIRVDGKTLFIQAGNIPGEELACTFYRTNRLPYKGGPFPLPPGIGTFPLERVNDHVQRILPKAWSDHGGVFFPMNEQEAFWISFRNRGRYAKAIKFSTGRVNAVTGALWDEKLRDDPQDYLIVGHPRASQPWLDGFHCGPGFIRQFVATPKGSGLSVEAQVTGVEKHGGVQLLVYLAKEPNPGRRAYKDDDTSSSSSSGSDDECCLSDSDDGGALSCDDSDDDDASFDDDDDDDDACEDEKEAAPEEPDDSEAEAEPDEAADADDAELDTEPEEPIEDLEEEAEMKMSKKECCDEMESDCSDDDFDDDEEEEGCSSDSDDDVSSLFGGQKAKAKIQQHPLPVQTKPPQEMCLAAGGKMRQRIVPDPEGLGFWNQDVTPAVVWIHMLNPQGFYEVTGKTMGPMPESWPESHWVEPTDGTGDVGVTETLANVKGLAELL